MVAKNTILYMALIFLTKNVYAAASTDVAKEATLATAGGRTVAAGGAGASASTSVPVAAGGAGASASTSAVSEFENRVTRSLSTGFFEIPSGGEGIRKRSPIKALFADRAVPSTVFAIHTQSSAYEIYKVAKALGVSDVFPEVISVSIGSHENIACMEFIKFFPPNGETILTTLSVADGEFVRSLKSRVDIYGSLNLADALDLLDNPAFYNILSKKGLRQYVMALMLTRPTDTEPRNVQICLREDGLRLMIIDLERDYFFNPLGSVKRYPSLLFHLPIEDLKGGDMISEISRINLPAVRSAYNEYWPRLKVSEFITLIANIQALLKAFPAINPHDLYVFSVFPFMKRDADVDVVSTSHWLAPFLLTKPDERYSSCVYFRWIQAFPISKLSEPTLEKIKEAYPKSIKTLGELGTEISAEILLLEWAVNFFGADKSPERVVEFYEKVSPLL